MSTSQPQRFGELLRHYRVAAGLTQEQLAERAGLSLRGISDLERGVNRTPQQGTFGLLAEALQLSAEEHAQFAAAARRHSAPNAQRSLGAPARSRIASPETPPVLETPVSAAVARPLAIQTGVAASPVGAAPRRSGLLLPRRARGKMVAGLLAVALLGATLLSAGVTAQHPQTAGGTLCLATDLPTTDPTVPIARQVQNAVDLAISQNPNLGDGYTLKVINYDDFTEANGDDPARGASNMTSMVKNACIVGMVGPFNSDVAQGDMSIAAKAGLAMISPSNTNPGLTLRPYAYDLRVGFTFDQLHPPGTKNYYFRNIANDAFQGEVDANYVFDNLAAHSAYIVVNRTPYGGDLASSFTKEFLARGGTIVATESVPWGDPSVFTQAAARIAAATPDVVYYAGTVEGGGPLLKQQLVQHGYMGPFVTGDAIAGDPNFLAQAGATVAQNTFASEPVPDLSTFTSGAAAQFLRDYHAKYPGQHLDGYCANAYDAAMILITAIKNLIRAGQAVTRAAVIDQVQTIQYVGVTGAIRFDENGDDAHGLFSIYAVQNGAWVLDTHLTV